MAKGRLSLESVGRLVEREREACFRSPKAVFERTPSKECPSLQHSISDSLAEAAFTMELGDCDVDPEEEGCPNSCAASSSSGKSLYYQSPYNYSYCAFSNYDPSSSVRRNWHEMNEKEASGGAAWEAGAVRPSTFSGHTLEDAADEIAHAQKALSRVSTEAHTRAAVAQKTGRKSGVTPTNIEDGIGKFVEGNNGNAKGRSRD